MSQDRAIPKHVAIIMDGNGRWAKQRNKERYEGHIAGVESVRAAVRAAVRNGVEWLTLYAFSTENWGRPTAEVEAIMELFCRTVMGEADDLARQGVRVKIMGERTRFTAKVLDMIDHIEKTTAEATRLTLVLAFNYSARREMILATQALAERVSKELTIPTIGIGAGGATDGQVLVVHDMLGINKGFSPRFLRRYADLYTIMTEAISHYVEDVKSCDFPNEKEQY